MRTESDTMRGGISPCDKQENSKSLLTAMSLNGAVTVSTTLARSNARKSTCICPASIFAMSAKTVVSDNERPNTYRTQHVVGDLLHELAAADDDVEVLELVLVELGVQQELGHGHDRLHRVAHLLRPRSRN